MIAEYIFRRRTVNLLANKTFTRVDSGSSITNYLAAGEVDVTLPADAAPGDFFDGAVATAQKLQFKAGAAAVFILAGTALAAGHGISSSTAGSTCMMECIAAGVWLVRGGTGFADQA